MSVNMNQTVCYLLDYVTGGERNVVFFRLSELITQ